MNNPVLKFFVYRVALFALVFALVWALMPSQPMLAALFAAMISFSLSLIFLRKQRDAMSAHLYEASQRKRDGLAKPGTQDVENDLLDGKSQ